MTEFLTQVIQDPTSFQHQLTLLIVGVIGLTFIIKIVHKNYTR
ncbi:Uncharacterised protein [[Clostridium] sordellii]|nr:hypothetical protein [Paeniclostridium sordellii]MDU1454926.1 hypothetical protein [Paeniclostridium sordellii]CEO04806.1 Uncharacterised protein [[Clostridium] sordellii] [Paeniclostridium sordellii]